MGNAEPGGGSTASHALLARTIGCPPSEVRPALWSGAYFFCLLAGWYTLRPVRDEMGIRGGVDELQWLFTATFPGASKSCEGLSRA
jgi:AAA family ATP:ADP antiporter